MRLISGPAEVRVCVFKELEKSVDFDLDTCIRNVSSVLPLIDIGNKGVLFGNDMNGDTINNFSEQFAKIKVLSKEPAADRQPMPAEIRFEVSRLEGRNTVSAMPYDGFEVSKIYKKRLRDVSLKKIAVIVTDRLIASNETDGEWHARVAIFSSPSIISTTGIVEAPAKSRDYYVTKNLLRSLKGSSDAGFIEDEEDHIGYGDSRMPRIVESYLIKSVFYALTGNPFCGDPDCRLYNSHWQKELIKAQVMSPLCNKHKEMVDNWRTISSCTS